MVKMDKIIRNIFTGFISTVLMTTECFGASDNCRNAFYRQKHPDQCQETESASKTKTVIAVVGGAVLAGAGIALANASSGGDSSGSASGNQQTITRSSNARATYALNDSIKNKKIYKSYIESATKGSDIAPEQIEAIRNSANYIKNQRHFDSINFAWATARGFSGKNITVNVLDDFEHYHGFAAHDIVSYIAKDAKIYDSYLTNSANNFKSFDTIANIMRNAAPADIYNSSWQVPYSASQNAATVAYNRFNPKTYKNAQDYMYAMISHNFITEMINLAADNDSIFVWSAGNDSKTERGLLAAAPLAFPELQGHFVNVVAVDAKTNTLAWYSNQCGVTQNYCIAAPGSGIKTDARNATVTGTSFAAPIVSGAIAVIKEAFPYMDASQITALLFTTAKDLGKPGVDEVYGWGLLDMEAATKPVGTPKIVLSDDNIVPLTTTNVGGVAGSAIKNTSIKVAFVDDFGRAFTTNLSDNINVVPYGRAFDKLTESDNNSVNLFGDLEFGFAKNTLLESNGLISAKSGNYSNFIGYKNTFNIGNIEFYQKARFGVSAPKSDDNSIISGFSDIYTASIKTGIQYKDFGFEFAVPETVLQGHAYMNLPVARADNGQIVYNNFTIDLTTRPSFEYSVKYKNIHAGYINNADYQDEFYILAKGKFVF